MLRLVWCHFNNWNALASAFRQLKFNSVYSQYCNIIFNTVSFSFNNILLQLPRQHYYIVIVSLNIVIQLNQELYVVNLLIALIFSGFWSYIYLNYKYMEITIRKHDHKILFVATINLALYFNTKI